jgi:phage terminase large subunit
LWDGITSDGNRIIEYFLPKELVSSVNQSEMKIRLINESIIQFCGSTDFDRLVGTNAVGMVFSEFALQDPRAWQFLRPILVGNQGWALFQSTPRGRNHLYEIYNIAQQSDSWFCDKLTLDDTQHVSLADIEKEREECSEDLIQQEWFTSFSAGVEGAYYAKYIDKMRLKDQIGNVPWEESCVVHTAWDIGVNDTTAIIFFQAIGQTVRIIDCYEKNNVGLEHYVSVLKNKPYTYGKHIGPHDIKVREWAGNGLTRIEKARQLGITFTVAPNISIVDGIESVRSVFSRTWIDEIQCAPLVKALENYRKEYDAKRHTYHEHPLHDRFSNYADSMRYLAVSLPKTRDGLSPEDLEKRYQEAVLGKNANMPSIFRDDLPTY